MYKKPSIVSFTYFESSEDETNICLLITRVRNLIQSKKEGNLLHRTLPYIMVKTQKVHFQGKEYKLQYSMPTKAAWNFQGSNSDLNSSVVSPSTR